jgi:hypothetical protein
MLKLTGSFQLFVERTMGAHRSEQDGEKAGEGGEAQAADIRLHKL